MVYCSTHLSLATLEVLVHANKKTLQKKLTSILIEVPEHLIQQLPDGWLPDGWNDYPEGDESKGIGDGWARSMVSLGMSVPSATMPNATKIEEQNVLINPMHSQFKQIKFIEQHDFDFDSRIKKLLE